MRTRILARRIFTRKQSLQCGNENADIALGGEYLQSRKSIARMVEKKQDVERLDFELNKLAQRSDLQRSDYVQLIRACTRARALSVGRRVHSFLISRSTRDPYLANCLVNMYSKCRRMDEARQVFEEMQQKNVVSWNIMVAAYIFNGDPTKAVEMFRKMEAEGVRPSEVSFLLVIGACSAAGNLTEGAAFHWRITRELQQLPCFLCSALINMYGKHGSLDRARQVFETMVARNSGSWNSIIGVYSQQGQAEEALQLFHRMDVEADEVTFVNALDACASLGDPVQGRLVHSRIYDRLSGSEIVNTALVNMYGKCGSLVDARSVFDRMTPRQDVVAWTSMITAYLKQGHSRDAVEIYQRMEQEGVKPDQIVYASVLDAYADAGDLKQGKLVHERLIANGLEPDTFVATALVNLYRKCGSLQDARVTFGKVQGDETIPWNSMICAFTEQGNSYEALQLFRKMDWEGIKPDRVTVNCILSALCSPIYLEDGRSIHARSVASGFSMDIVGIALVKMYGLCRSIEDARAVFDVLSYKDVVSWTVMIGAYAGQGNSKDAMELYQQMCDAGVRPNEVTLTSLLEACAITGDLTQGEIIHSRVFADGYEQDVMVATALVNMYAKCGHIATAKRVFSGIQGRDIIAYTAMMSAHVLHDEYLEALELFYKMEPEGMKPDKVAYMSALEACAGLSSLKHGRAVHASIEANGLSKDISLANLLITLYGRCGSLKDARNFFNAMSWKDTVTWNSMLGAYAQHGHDDTVLELFDDMKLDGVEPDVVTFLTVLFTCSHAGLLEEAYEHFALMNDDYGLEPVSEHYGCMIDLLGRAGDLEAAEKLISRMSEPSSAVWMALMAACRTHGDVNRGSRAAKRAWDLDPMSVAPVLLSNIVVEGVSG